MPKSDNTLLQVWTSSLRLVSVATATECEHGVPRQQVVLKMEESFGNIYNWSKIQRFVPPFLYCLRSYRNLHQGPRRHFKDCERLEAWSTSCWKLFLCRGQTIMSSFPSHRRKAQVFAISTNLCKGLTIKQANIPRYRNIAQSYMICPYILTF